MLIRTLMPVLLVICLRTASGQHHVVRWLKSQRITNWGTWGLKELCPINTWVTGMRLKTEEVQGATRDDTALNAIELICSTLNRQHNTAITSKIGYWGYFNKKKYCLNGVATGFQLRSEKPQSNKDDVAAVDFRLKCTHFDGTTSYIKRKSLPWGNWTKEEICPSETAVCGIATQVQNVLLNGDDTSLNNVDIACCKVPHPSESCQLEEIWEDITACQGKQDCEIKFTAEITKNDSSNSSESALFFQKLGYPESFQFALNALKTKAALFTFSQKGTKKINNKSLESIISETGINQQQFSFEEGCEGIRQKYIVTCGTYKLYTKEHRCIPSENGNGFIHGLYFQPTTSFGNIVWGYYCDFKSENLRSRKSRIEDCGEICSDDGVCNHYTWTSNLNGTCYLKQSNIIPAPYEKLDNKTVVCGWIEKN